MRTARERRLLRAKRIVLRCMVTEMENIKNRSLIDLLESLPQTGPKFAKFDAD